MPETDLLYRERFFSSFGFPRTQRLLEKVPFAIVVLDAEQRIIYLNETAEAIYQCPLKTAHGRSLLSILFVSDTEIITRALATAFGGKVVFNLTWSEEQYYPGRLFWRQATFIPFRDEGGAVEHVIVTIHDITDHLREQKRLLKSQEHYRMLFDCAPESMLVLERYAVRGVNPAWEKFSGFAEGELVGIHVAQLCPSSQQDGSDSREALEGLIDLVLAGKKQSFPWQWKKKNGDIVTSYVSMGHMSGFRSPELAALVHVLVWAQKDSISFR